MGRDCEPLLQWKINRYCIFWAFICSLSFPARNAPASYCHQWPALLYNIFSHYVIKRHDFLKKKLSSTKCVFWFSLQMLSETFLILRRTKRHMIKMYVGLHVKYPLFLCDFKKTLIFSTDCRKILKYEISWKSVEWEPSCSLRTNGQMTKVTVAFLNVANCRLPANFV
jgi:hypothetical protein